MAGIGNGTDHRVVKSSEAPSTPISALFAWSVAITTRLPKNSNQPWFWLWLTQNSHTDGCPTPYVSCSFSLSSLINTLHSTPSIAINGQSVDPIDFDTVAFPPDHPKLAVNTSSDEADGTTTRRWPVNRTYSRQSCTLDALRPTRSGVSRRARSETYVDNHIHTQERE